MTKDAVSFKRESCAERVQWVASWLDFVNSSVVPRYRGDFFGSGGNMAQGKERADKLVFAQGLAESRGMAKCLIMADKVALEDVSGVRQKVDKPGHRYPLDMVFALVGIEKYVSRGVYKLLTAIEHFKPDVTRFVCLDAGASTGGFTDCLLQHDAAKVYAVDVGKEQLHERMRHDPRVISMEGTNLCTAPEELIPKPADIIATDVSLISLTLVLPPCVRWLKEGGLVAALVKPQFELGPHQTDKGVVRDPTLRQQVVDRVLLFCQERLGPECLGIVPAAVKGPKGNQEYIICLRRLEAGQVACGSEVEQ